MAITQEELLVNVEVQTRNAAQSLQSLNDKFEALQDELKSTNASVKSAEKAMTGFGAASVKMNQALELAKKGVQFLIEPIKKSVNDFIAAQASIDKMRKSVREFGTGDLAASIKRFEELREEIESNTLAEGEMVDSMVAAAKQLGISDDMTEKLVRTATDLAEVQGGDVQESFKQLLATLKGQGKAVGQYSVLLSGLTEEQLKAGKGVDVLSERFAGMAEKAAKTLPGTFALIERTIGDLFEEVGEIIAKGFDVQGSAEATLEMLRSIKEALEDLKPAAIDAARQMVQFSRAVAEGLSRVDWEGLAAGIGVIGSAIALAFAPRIIAQVTAFAAALKASAVPAVILAAKVTIIAAGIAAIGAAVDIAIRNLDLLKNSFLLAFASVRQQANEVGLAIISMLTKAVVKAAEAFPAIKDIATTAIASLNEEFNNLADGAIKASQESEELGKKVTEGIANLDTGFAGKIFDSATGFIQGFNEEMAKVAPGANAAGEALAAAGNRGALGLGGMNGVAQDTAKLLEELTKKVGDLERQRAEVGASEGKLIEIRMKDQERELDLLAEKLRLSGQLSKPAIAAQVAAGKLAIEQTRLAQIEELRKKNLDDVRQSTLALAAEVAGMDATTHERIEAERVAALQVLDLKRKELEKDKDINREALAALDAQAELIELRAQKQTERAPGPQFEAAAQAGQNIANSISGAFTSGALGAVTGIMSGVGAIADVAQGIVDFIPQMLQKISGLVNSITELPNAILKGVQGLFGAVLKFVQDFIPNVIKMIGGLLEAAVSFIETLPDVLINMLDSLPDMIIGLLERLPELAERLITALITAAPRLLTQAVSFLVRDAPRIVVSMLKVFAVELPKATTKALIDAFRQVGGMLSDLFKGKLPKIDIDHAAISKGMKAAAGTLSGESEKLFKVMDLKDAEAADDKAKQLAAAIENGMEKALSIWRKFWDELVKAWRALWDFIDKQILKPIAKALQEVFNFLREVWLFVYDNIIEPLIMGLRQVWLFIYDTVIKPLLDGLKAIWDFVFNTVVKPLLDGLNAVWNFVIDSVVKPLLSGLSEVWKVITDALGALWNSIKSIFEAFAKVLGSIFETARGIFKVFTDALSSAWNAAKEIFGNIGATFSNLGKSIWDGFKSALQAGASAVTGLGSKIWDGLKTGLGGLGTAVQTALDKINPLNLASKMFQFDSGGTGTVEKALGIDVPFTAFAKGGVVMGSPVVSGDSPLNDRILALLSPGEAVIPRSQMENPAIRALVQAVIDGRLAPPGHWGGKVKVGGYSVGVSSSGVSVEGPPPMKPPTFNDVIDMGKDAGAVLSQLYKDSGIADLLGNLDPTKAWNKVREVLFSQIMKMFQHGFNAGGLVGADSTFARLTPGEFVMNRGAVSDYGLETMRAMNSGNAPAAPNNTEVNINLTVHTTQPMDENFIRNKLLPRVKEEFKRATIDGQGLVFASGVRTL